MLKKKKQGMRFACPDERHVERGIFSAYGGAVDWGWGVGGVERLRMARVSLPVDPAL